MKVSKYQSQCFFAVVTCFLAACNNQHSSSDIAAPDTAASQPVIQSALDGDSALPDQDPRIQWLDAIENSGIVDIAAIDNDVQKIRRDLIIDQYFEALYADQVDTAAIEQYYRSHQEQFISERVDIAHILIRTPAAASKEEHAAANTRAHELVSKLHTGEDFASLAKNYSEDSASAKNGGALGWVRQGGISDDVLQVALALEAGGVSEPVIQKYGIHIIKKLSSNSTQARPLTAVRAKISQLLRAEVKGKAIKALALAE